jgi:2-amino-4-hydroxy-6-hydroxymethyldihydropteridine diphosphokinase
MRKALRGAVGGAGAAAAVVAAARAEPVVLVVLVVLPVVAGAREPKMAVLWRPAYVALGSNLQSPEERVNEAFGRLDALPQVASLQRSRLYRSRPLGPQDQPDYINAAAGFLTLLSAPQLLAQLLEIERAMGRHREARWGPRIIDLDLVWMNDAATRGPDLTVPHPGVSSRNFVLYPLADLAPTLDIPGYGDVQTLMRAVGAADISVLA